MGHYRCPRCGSTDSYVGNVMLAKPGGYISHELAGTDAMGSVPVPGGHKVVQARKCKACGEILTESNYEKTEAERAKEMHERAVKTAQVRSFVKKETDSLVSAFMIFLLLGLGGAGAGLILVGALKFFSGEYVFAVVGMLAGFVLAAFFWRMSKLWWSEKAEMERESIRASVFRTLDGLLLYLIGVGLLFLLAWLSGSFR